MFYESQIVLICTYLLVFLHIFFYPTYSYGVDSVYSLLKMAAVFKLTSKASGCLNML